VVALAYRATVDVPAAEGDCRYRGRAVDHRPDGGLRASALPGLQTLSFQVLSHGQIHFVLSRYGDGRSALRGAADDGQEHDADENL
jgi:hypothetical protein